MPFVRKVRSCVKTCLLLFPTINILNYTNIIQKLLFHVKIHYIVQAYITLCHVKSGVSPSNSALSKYVSYICFLLRCVALWTHTPWNGSSAHLKTHHHEVSTEFVSESNFNRNSSEDLVQKGKSSITNTTLVSNFKWLRRQRR